MLLEEIKVHKLDVNMADVYPRVKTPLTEKTLLKIYKDFNKLYFGGALPNNVPITIKSLGGEWGITHYKFNNGDIRMEINKKIITSIKSTVDVLIHEMIHVSTFSQYTKTKDRKYLEEYISKNQKMAGMINGHGVLFIKDMHRLNRLGFEIDLQSNMEAKVAIDDMYVMIGQMINGSDFLVYSDKDFRKNLDATIDSIIENLGVGQLQSYSIMTSSDVALLSGVKLTASGKLKTNANLGNFNRSALSKLLKDRKYLEKDVVVDSTGTGIDEIDEDIIKMIKAANKNFRAGSFKRYLTIIFNNVSAYKTFVTMASIYEYPREFKGVSKETIEFIYGEWGKIKPQEIRSSTDFKNIISWMDDLIEGNMNTTDIIKYADVLYGEVYKERMPEKEFYKIVYDALIARAMKLISGSLYIFKTWFPDEEFGKFKVTKKVVVELFRRTFKGTKLG